jgi:uncharacterized membrane protein
MRVSLDSNSLSARALWAGVWGIMCAMILAAPLLLLHAYVHIASVFYLAFSVFCHQIPDRSFFLSGHPLAACHRCCGMYLGFFLGSFIHIPFVHRSPLTRRIWVLSACTPLLVDVLLAHCGLWRSTCLSRFATGLFLGCLISPLLVPGITEFLRKTRLRSIKFEIRKSREAIHE